jgi:signal transduction histidine kinase
MTTNLTQEVATILVVDDNEANRALARGALEDEGYRVVEAKGGAEGIQAFELEKPDCVLLDVRMPEVDGFAVCSRIRAMPRGSDTPIVFLTALRDVDTFDHALEAGADDFLTKPVRPGELVVRVETALKMRNMRAELREHYDLLKRQRDQLLRLQLQKERLMSFVVHDLKNPVNSMDLHAQLLLRDPALPERSRNSATQIRAEARQLARMILNLLDLSKGDEGKLVAKQADVDAASLVDGVFGELGAAAQVRRVKLEANGTANRITADEDLLRRTLANLLENAIRHAATDTTVSVSIASNGADTEIRVVDRGPGIPAELRERVFDPFVQVEGNDLRSTRTGRGLGLAFCKLAVEAHGGRIWIEDASPGAIFCVSIPHGR